MVNSAQAMASRRPVAGPDDGGGGAYGRSLFAGVILFIAGTFQALLGVVALFTNTIYGKPPGYLFKLDATSWGWVHLLLGLVVLAAGIGVVAAQGWARVVGIIVVAASALANFMFIPYYPAWALLIIALDVVVIWALSTYRPEY